jgi:hypothetical protein
MGIEERISQDRRRSTLNGINHEANTSRSTQDEKELLERTGHAPHVNAIPH